jgi:hypothetical protein
MFPVLSSLTDLYLRLRLRGMEQLGLTARETTSPSSYSSRLAIVGFKQYISDLRDLHCQ